MSHHPGVQLSFQAGRNTQRIPQESADPDHYKTDSVECIDAIRAALGKEGFIAYCRGQILRYAWRFGKKDAEHIEAQKIEVYAVWLHDATADTPLRKGMK